ncbi:MAG: hypothetical protein HC840_00145 [Leptolyngbyaceae cyanobacterium RM2_2_4]|nr:hypothetical protein [Leptolyngbyaceae cyanobacterium RM2_2_4]
MDLLNDVQPFLRLKKQQCDNLRALIATTEVGKYGAKRPKPKHLIAYHNQLYRDNKSLNSKKKGKSNVSASN